jgi:hypothetical protein
VLYRFEVPRSAAKEEGGRQSGKSTMASLLDKSGKPEKVLQSRSRSHRLNTTK